jgi:hypothetical protein
LITGGGCELFRREQHEIRREEFAGLGKGLGFWVIKRKKQRGAVPLSKGVCLDNLGI